MTLPLICQFPYSTACMTNTLKNIPILLAKGDVAAAIEHLQAALALSESELVNDLVLISATYKKYKSDQRRGILSYQQDSLSYNRIINNILCLIEEIQENPEILSGFTKLEDEFEQVMRQRLEECLRQVTQQKHQVQLKAGHTDILFKRMSAHKNEQHSFHLLWVDDHPDTIGNEIELLQAIGAQIDHTTSTDQALTLIKEKEYTVILSDLVRQNDHSEGVRLLECLRELEENYPVIFYSQDIDWSRGTPPYAFGLAALPSDLLHLVMDVLDRKF